MSEVHPEILRMRAARAALEASLTGTLRREIESQRRLNAELHKELDVLSAVFRSELHDHLQKETAYRISDSVMRKISEQAMQPSDRDGSFTITLNRFEMMLQDPDSVARRILDAWLSRRGREARLRALDSYLSAQNQALCITFPALAITIEVPTSNP